MSQQPPSQPPGQPPFGQPPQGYWPPNQTPPTSGWQQPPNSQPPGGPPQWPGQPQPPYGTPPGSQPGQQPYPPQYPPQQYQQQYAPHPPGYYGPPPKQKKSGFLGGLGVGCLIAIGIAAVVLIGGIALIAVAVGGASKALNATATPFNSASIAQLNQIVSVPNWDLKATAIDKPGKTLAWSQFNNTSTAAGTWLVVTVDLKNTGTKNFGVNDHDFQLKDSTGNTYNVSSDTGASAYSEFKGGQRVGGQVPPGTTVRYYLVFDVGTSATGLTLQFEQGNKPLINLGQ